MTTPLLDDPATELALAHVLHPLGEDRFRIDPVPSGLLRLYGGTVLAQCLAAAQATVPPDKAAHALHACYLQPGLTDRPVECTVERMLDGRSFANRLVRMTQDGVALMTQMVSFKIAENALSHQVAMPEVPPPEALEPLAGIIAREGDGLPRRHWPFWHRPALVDWRPVEEFPFTERKLRPRGRHFWFRFTQPMADDPALHQRWLAYASDLHIYHTGLGPLGIGWADDHLQSSSLDHAVWFHAPARVDEWLLYAMESPAASNALALGRGNVFRRDGTLVATVSQQGLGRLLPEKREGKL